MAVFSVTKGTTRKILPIKAGLEREIQRLFERNLLLLLDIHFLHSEYPTNDGRIDTLGIDKTAAPVIIEYKRTKIKTS
jgi:RecB family endonuclease NucS